MAKAVTDLKPVMSGITEILKSPGTRSLLSNVAARATARCNSMCGASEKAKGALYMHQPVTLNYVAAERVIAPDRWSGLDNYRHNTLRKGCGL